jgi:hypothetical protein
MQTEAFLKRGVAHRSSKCPEEPSVQGALITLQDLKLSLWPNWIRVTQAIDRVKLLIETLEEPSVSLDKQESDFNGFFLNKCK